MKGDFTLKPIDQLTVTAKSFAMQSLFYLFRVCPVQKNKVVCSSFMGKGYGDNCKAIVEELIKDGRKYDIVWLSDPAVNQSVQFPSFIRTVPIKSAKAVYEMATAKVWLDNRRKPLYVRKRKNQFYMLTHHGNNGLKKLELDVKHTMSPRYIKAAIHDSKMCDVFLSGSKFDTWSYHHAYAYDGEILEKGYPRQDILVQADQKMIGSLKEKMGLSAEDHVLLYAPTFRQPFNEMDLALYDLDWTGVINAFQDKFGGNWVGLIRLHPNISNLAAKLHLPSNVKDMTLYPDFDELVVACDCLITDYSSTIIEAGISGRMGLFFAVDIEAYKKERDFYIPMEEWPFPLATSNEELIELINQFDQEKYKKDSDDFYQNRYGLFPLGKASYYAAERIRKAMRE